ncbi:uncharacterized protein LOC106697239 [Myotis lucifugus]|uniref:uncharacterized protein LOC106697239 n=1 Tax=Myotis lucifugus TaxID=59463 RepID=UPI0006D7409B|nr:uncharacterized protein LOC106697239 [Myotis lucifugus]
MPVGHRRGRDAGGAARPARPSRGSRGPGSSLSNKTLPPPPFCPSTPVSPPPYSAAGFPDVGISRRRLRGGRGLGASARPAAGRERSLRPPALRPLPCARRPLPCVGPAEPRAAPARAAQVTRPGAARGPRSRSPKPTHGPHCCYLSVELYGEYRIKMRISRSLIRRRKQQTVLSPTHILKPCHHGWIKKSCPNGERLHGVFSNIWVRICWECCGRDDQM